MTAMEVMTYDETQAQTALLEGQRQTWIDKRAVLQAELEQLQTGAGEAALAGTSTGKLAERIGRVEMEIQIAGRALQAAEGKLKEMKRAESLAYTEHLRQRAVELRQQAAALHMECEPHLEALHRLQGVRVWFEAGREVDLTNEAYRIERDVEERELRLRLEGR
jgi:hypothetical protein